MKTARFVLVVVIIVGFGFGCATVHIGAYEPYPAEVSKQDRVYLAVCDMFVSNKIGQDRDLRVPVRLHLGIKNKSEAILLSRKYTFRAQHPHCDIIWVDSEHVRFLVRDKDIDHLVSEPAVDKKLLAIEFEYDKLNGQFAEVPIHPTEIKPRRN